MELTVIDQKDWEARSPEEWEICQYCEGEGLVECDECGHITKQCRHCDGVGETKKASGYHKVRNSDQEKYRRWCEMMSLTEAV